MKQFDAFSAAVGKIAYTIIASFFRTKAVLKLLGLIAAAIILVRFIGWLPTLQLKRSPLAERVRPAADLILGEIPAGSGIVLAAESGGREMYVDTVSGNISIVDTYSGLVWNAIRSEENTAPEDMSLLRLTFLAQDNVITTWHSFNYSQRASNFTIHRIQNGIRMNMQVGNPDPSDINAFMPRRIAIDRYERVFLRGLDEKVEQGELDSSEADRYRSVLSMIYARDDTRGIYFNRLASALPASATRQMLTMARLLDYSVEQLVFDEAPFDLPAEDRRPPASFMIPINFTLDDGDFVVSITTEDIQTHNDFYTLIRLHVLPNFGSVTALESPDGFILVPDGSGALLRLNSFHSSYSVYERPLYWNTVFRDMDSMPQFPEDLHMPVYAMMYDRGGFFAIIEQGDETAFIGARLASSTPGTLGDRYNTVYSGFETSQFRQINIVGAVDHGGTYAVSTGMLAMDYTVRYKLFTQLATYFDLASVYRQYLAGQWGLQPDFSGAPRIYLDVTGALSVEGRFMGMAYERTVSMSSYTDLIAIMEDLADIPLAISYRGVFNGGIDNALTNRAVPVRQNGSPVDFNRMLETAGAAGIDLFLGTNMARIYRRSGNGLSERIHASIGFDGDPAYFRGYDLPTRQAGSLSSRYTLLNPLYLPHALGGFLSDAGHIGKLYIEDLARDYHASYRRNAIVGPLAGRIIVDEALQRLGQDRTLALNNPRLPFVPHGSWAVNISRESSNFGSFYTSIPFRQLVMNGFITFTTLDVNGFGESADYFLLQALELGSVPKYHITAHNADALKYTRHTNFLSTHYDVHRDGIMEMYRRWAQIFEAIGTTYITNHETLSDGVFRTTYLGGTAVTVNYNRFAVDIGGEILGPRAYSIREGE